MAFHVGELTVERGEELRGYLEVGRASTHDVDLPFIVINGEGEGPTLCVTAGVHSVECAPVEAALRLADSVEPGELKGTLVILPLVNTEGFHARTPYHNDLDHLNQNKVFPGDPEASVTKRVAHAVFESFVSKSDYLVDCHSADLGEDVRRAILIFKTDDEKLRSRMLEMASCFNPTIVDTAEISGNTGEAVNLYGIPCVMTESGTPYPIREEDVLFHLDGLRNLLRHLGMMDGEAALGRPPVDPKAQRLWAERGGIWRRDVEAGEKVREGQRLGEVSDLVGETLQEVTAPFEGIVSFLRTHYSVNAGDTLLWVADV
jgi:hypothetical protein